MENGLRVRMFSPRGQRRDFRESLNPELLSAFIGVHLRFLNCLPFEKNGGRCASPAVCGFKPFAA